MSSVLIILLGIIIGIIIAFTILLFCFKLYLKKTLGANYSILKDEIKNIGTNRKMEYSKEKSIGGMTNIVEPRIMEDFESFNKDVLYTKVKEDILSVLNYFTEKKVEDNKELILIKHYLKETISNMIENSIEEKFKNPKVLRTVIKDYKKFKGAATITLSSSVSFYYETNKKVVQYDDVRKYVRIDTEYVYVYDENEFENETHFSLNCPSCGASIKNISGTCAYCAAYIEPINLKAWKINKIEIKE